MIYKIKNKYYVKVQGYYKEVRVDKNGDNLDVTPIANAKKLEITKVNDAVIVDPKKENFNKTNIFEKQEM